LPAGLGINAHVGFFPQTVAHSWTGLIRGHGILKGMGMSEYFARNGDGERNACTGRLQPKIIL